jgi:hypothetical protein
MVTPSALTAWAKSAPLGARVLYDPEVDAAAAGRLYRAGKIMCFQRKGLFIAVRVGPTTAAILEKAGRKAWAKRGRK